MAEPPSAGRTTHTIEWASGAVRWASYAAAAGAGAPFAHFRSTDDVPAATSSMRVHLNLWVFRGASAMAKDELDVALANFSFTPAPACA